MSGLTAATLGMLAQAPPDLSVYRMQPMGWVFMLGSIGAVLTLVVFCYWKVLTDPGAEEELHAPLDLDTHDRGT